MRRLIILSNIKFNMKQAFNILLLVCFLMGVAACGQKSEKEQPEQKEDTTAKKLLQGIWLDGDDEDNVVFRVKGDTIYYPDSTSQPVYFYIVGDTLVMKGANLSKYPIMKQAAHISSLRFRMVILSSLSRLMICLICSNSLMNSL